MAGYVVTVTRPADSSRPSFPACNHDELRCECLVVSRQTVGTLDFEEVKEVADELLSDRHAQSLAENDDRTFIEWAPEWGAAAAALDKLDGPGEVKLPDGATLAITVEPAGEEK